MTVQDRLHEYAAMTEQALSRALPESNTPYAAYDGLVEAMRYSLLAGGKRIRAALCLEFCRLCGGDPAAALPFACALEMIHASSLIHDDLPCMDDDDLRRGKPSCHVAFGEAQALLAGDALLLLAFEAAAGAKDLDPGRITRAVSVLARCAGYAGMCGGQAMDLEAEQTPSDLKTLERTDRAKTGMMIVAAAVMGCIAGGAAPQQLQAAEEYAKRIGLVFQMVDDVLDVTATEEELGKPIGSDVESNKTTYVTLLGAEQTMETAAAHNQQAKQALVPFGEDAAFLCDLADWLLHRSF